MNIQEKLVALLAAKFTQARKDGLQQLARSHANINDALLRKYFAGVTTPSITNVEKIVEAMGYEIKIVKKEEKA